jgi:hypothetical protein
MGALLSRLIENAKEDLWDTVLHQIPGWNDTYPNDEGFARFQRQRQQERSQSSFD